MGTLPSRGFWPREDLLKMIIRTSVLAIPFVALAVACGGSQAPAESPEGAATEETTEETAVEEEAFEETAVEEEAVEEPAAEEAAGEEADAAE